MPENPDFVTSEQYQAYTAAWEALIASGDNDTLRQAFQVPEVTRITFFTFSLDQVLALVSADKVRGIKARFLLRRDAANVAHASIALFAADADGQPLTDYYVPTPAAATTTQTVEPAPGPDTTIPQPQALAWLTAWLMADPFTTDIFTTDSGPLQGFNFEVSTFQDPLAAAPPYAGKTLFVNLALISDPEPTSALVVYSAALSSRTQGSVEGLSRAGSYYDQGNACPPNH